jgi:hypothetical protein
MLNVARHVDKICLVCKKPLSFNYPNTLVRKAVKPPRSYKRWIELGAVHEECEHLIELERDKWKKN